MRIGLAFRAFFAALSGRDTPALESGPAPSNEELVRAVATQTVGLFQAEGRLLDFLAEDISSYSDAEVGQVVREVHRGCKRALEDHFTLEPILKDAEESEVTVGEGFDPLEIRVVGQVLGQPPFTGTLKHGGYRATEVRLPPPPVGPSSTVVSPAEVEI